MAFALSTVAIIGLSAGVAGGVGGSILKGRNARKDKRAAESKRRIAESNLNNLIATRQDIINPFEDVVDLSGNLSNPFSNLGVATQAAEIQMEQTDIALANTLDTIRATGGGAGGATALAQAALQSKKGVTANIEQQESKNQAMQAKGEQDLQVQRMSEQQRVQLAQAKGKAYEFEAREEREVAELDRAQNALDEQRQRKQDATDLGREAGQDAFGTLGSLGKELLSFGLTS